MDDDLHLWKISTDRSWSQLANGSYSSAVVAAWTEYDARRVHPSGTVIGEVWTGGAHVWTSPSAWDAETWCAIDDVKVERVGVASIHVRPGTVICRSRG